MKTKDSCCNKTAKKTTSTIASYINAKLYPQSFYNTSIHHSYIKSAKVKYLYMSFFIQSHFIYKSTTKTILIHFNVIQILQHRSLYIKFNIQFHHNHTTWFNKVVLRISYIIQVTFYIIIIQLLRCI